MRGYSAKLLSLATSVVTGEVTPVQQQFAQEVDINTIVRRYGITGELPFGNAGGVYGDFTGISDYASAVAAIQRAEEGFMTLPPEIRERFDNDPGALWQFAQGVSEEDFSAAVMPAAVPPPGFGDSPPPVEGVQ